MTRLHIRNWPWIASGMLNPVSPGTDLCYATLFGDQTCAMGLSQWALDILRASNGWRALRIAGDELYDAVFRVLEKGVPS